MVKMKKESWDKFLNTGNVEDYLDYKNRQKKYLNEMGTEVIIKNSKRDNCDQSNGRDSSKK
ncbi:MAG: hypothetical protein K0Q49_99 [Haloplasmataceae bacterium]|jgi:hypothetical protein|nr:hypothetical protein [Haloplasmataceae bacterium]